MWQETTAGWIISLCCSFGTHRSAAAQPQGGHSKAYCADGQLGQFVSVVRNGGTTLSQRKAIGPVLSRDEILIKNGQFNRRVSRKLTNPSALWASKKQAGC
jgi:hypothetical protein